MAKIEERHGRLVVPWSEVNRLVRGDLDIGIGGGPDLLHAVYGESIDGRFEGIAGDELDADDRDDEEEKRLF